MKDIKIRPAIISDVSGITELSKQLGYDINEQETMRNMLLLKDTASEAVLTALINENIVGWLQVSYLIRMESGVFCEIVGLVVDEKYRGRGIGKMLIEQAKQWCKEKKCTKLKVRTNVKRLDTHKFYSSAGFFEVKEQKIFEMTV